MRECVQRYFIVYQINSSSVFWESGFRESLAEIGNLPVLPVYVVVFVVVNTIRSKWRVCGEIHNIT
jgi:hypothetical protein